MITYEAGNEGWNTTFPEPSFEAQLSKPTLKKNISDFSGLYFRMPL